ncbi:MAG: zinc-binding dehydrogenase [Halioglobus sp.]
MGSSQTSIPLAHIHGVDDLRVDAVPAPTCGPDDVLVKVRECGICGSDLGYLSMGGLMGPDTPMPLGHELWGEVSETGANVQHVVVGDRVVVQPMSNGNNIGNGGGEGGFSPLLLVRNAASDTGSVVKLPETLPSTYGALVEPLAVAQHGLNRLCVEADNKVVIYGAGPIGLCMLLALQYRGVKDVIMVDLAQERLDLAAKLGAIALRADDEALLDTLIERHGKRSFFGMPMPATDVIFEATGVRSVFETIVAIAGPGSRIGLTGVHKEAATVDLVMLLAKEVSIVPAMGYENEFEEVIAMLDSGEVDPSPLISHRFALSNLNEAFAMARDTSLAVKIIVDCQN